jgi:hypothetical protein
MSDLELKGTYGKVKEIPLHQVASIAGSRDGLISPALMRLAGTEPEMQEEDIGDFSEVISIWKLNSSRPLLECERRWIAAAERELVRRIVERERRPFWSIQSSSN